MPCLRPPPLDFIPVQVCEWAELADLQPEFIHRPIRRGRRLQGIKYEAAGQVWLRHQYGTAYVGGQWIRFRADGQGKTRWCQTDGILVDAEHKVLTIIEFKYQHTENAWWQLFRLYKPVVEKLFSGRGFRVKCLEICKWFDPAIRAPQAPVLCQNIGAVQEGEFGVHIWKP
jgi:hypothetical protein